MLFGLAVDSFPSGEFYLLLMPARNKVNCLCMSHMSQITSEVPNIVAFAATQRQTNSS